MMFPERNRERHGPCWRTHKAVGGFLCRPCLDGASAPAISRARGLGNLHTHSFEAGCNVNDGTRAVLILQKGGSERVFREKCGLRIPSKRPRRSGGAASLSQFLEPSLGGIDGGAANAMAVNPHTVGLESPSLGDFHIGMRDEWRHPKSPRDRSGCNGLLGKRFNGRLDRSLAGVGPEARRFDVTGVRWPETRRPASRLACGDLDGREWYLDFSDFLGVCPRFYDSCRLDGRSATGSIAGLAFSLGMESFACTSAAAISLDASPVPRPSDFVKDVCVAIIAGSEDERLDDDLCHLLRTTRWVRRLAAAGAAVRTVIAQAMHQAAIGDAGLRTAFDRRAEFPAR